MRFLLSVFLLITMTACGGQKAAQNVSNGPHASNGATAPASPGDGYNSIDVIDGNFADVPMNAASPGNSVDPPMNIAFPGNVGDPAGNTMSSPLPVPQDVTPARRRQFETHCRHERIDGAACADMISRYAVLESGIGALAVDGRMYVNRPTTVALAMVETPDGQHVVNVTTQAEDMAGSRVPVESGTSPVIRSIPIQMGSRMRIELQGSGFTIEPAGPIILDTGMSSRHAVEWRVTPQAAGPQTLTATIQPIARVGDRDTPIADAAERSLQVTVNVEPKTIWQKIKEFFETTTGIITGITALLAAIAGLIVAWRRLFGKGEAEPE